MGDRCPKCGNTDESYMNYGPNSITCVYGDFEHTCDTTWSTIPGKDISEFYFDKCPKCSSTSLQKSCSGKCLCNGCMFFWNPGEEEQGIYLNGEPTEASSGKCPGDINKLLNTPGAKCCSCGCCNCKRAKQYEEEQKEPEKKKKGGCCGGCCNKTKASSNMDAIKKEMNSIEVPEDPDELPPVIEKIKRIIAKLSTYINPS